MSRKAWGFTTGVAVILLVLVAWPGRDRSGLRSSPEAAPDATAPAPPHASPPEPRAENVGSQPRPGPARPEEPLTVDPAVADLIEKMETVETFRRITETPVTVEFDAPSMDSLFRRLEELLAIEVRVAPDAEGALSGKRGQASFENAPGSALLQMIADVHGLSVHPTARGVEFRRADAATEPLDPEATRLVRLLTHCRRQAVREAAARSRRGGPEAVAAGEAELPPALAERRKDALRKIARTRELMAATDARLRGGRITVSALVDAVRGASGHGVVIDPRVLGRRVTVAGGESVLQALGRLKSVGADWTLRDGKIVIFRAE